MKPVALLINAVMVSLAAGSATAQFVKGNEAVSVMPDGTKKVETPPLPSVALGEPCDATKPSCNAGRWQMIETKSGLAECTEIFARPGTCRASSFGSEKLSRTWIVKTKGRWMQCERPEISPRCVSLKALPVSAVQ